MDPFAGRRLNTLTAADLEGLVEASVPEGQHLEYMRDFGTFFDGNQQRARNGRRDFLAEVTAFANADGGLILVGVEEERDDDGNPTGVAASVSGVTVNNTDKTVQAIEQILAQGIDERLQGVELVVITLADAQHVVAIRVAASLRGPHMVTLGGSMSFYVRTNTGKQPMSTAQIRDNAMRGATVVERARRRLYDRLNELYRIADGKSFWCVHLMPLIPEGNALDVTRIGEGILPAIQQWHVGAGSHCLEGYKLSTVGTAPGLHKSHSIASRDGWIEFYDERYVRVAEGRERAVWPYGVAEDEAFMAIWTALSLYREGRLHPPLLLSIALGNLGELWLPSRSMVHDWSRFTASDIVPSPVVLHEVPDSEEEVRRAMKPLLDVVWNAGGRDRCWAYDESGVFVGHPR